VVSIAMTRGLAHGTAASLGLLLERCAAPLLIAAGAGLAAIGRE
jgi:hypothetical protein